MKTSLLLATLLITSFAVRAQDPAPLTGDELAKATALLMDANSRLGDQPLKLELAPDRATGLKAGEVGALVIPDKRFKFDKEDKANKKQNKGAAQPVGQLWTTKISPKDKDAVLPNSSLQLVKVQAGEKQMELAVFTLGIERAGKKEFQLVLYGKGKSPVLRIPLTAEKDKGASPVTMTARKTGEESGVLELKLLGRLKGEIPVGKQAE